jgi:hypothetical protein
MQAQMGAHTTLEAFPSCLTLAIHAMQAQIFRRVSLKHFAQFILVHPKSFPFRLPDHPRTRKAIVMMAASANEKPKTLTIAFVSCNKFHMSARVKSLQHT